MTQAVGDSITKYLASTTVGWAAGSGPDGLANSLYAQLSDEVFVSSFSTDGLTDILVSGKTGTGSGTLAANPFVQIFAAAPVNSIYPDQANYSRVGKGIVITTGSTDTRGQNYSLASAFGGALPARVKFTLLDRSGLALGGSAGGQAVTQVFIEPQYINTKLS